MEYLLAVLCGIIQGITEFLPISSTAHLLILDFLVGGIPTHERFFEVAIQSGSACALLIFYFNTFIRLLRTEKRFWGAYSIALLPAIIMGVLFSSFIKKILYCPQTFGFSLLIGGIIMVGIEKLKNSRSTTTLEGIQIQQGLLIGFLQAIALIPGASRLATTLIGGKLGGLDRATAVDFSFLIGIPLLFGAAAHDFIKNFSSLSTASIELTCIGWISTFITSLMAFTLCRNLLIRYGLAPFGWYRIALGTLIFVCFI